MPATSLGTASAAKMFVALTLLPPSPTALPPELEARPTARVTSHLRLSETAFYVPTAVSNDHRYAESVRPTTLQEKLIGEIRQWSLLEADWDGEGAAVPAAQSMKEAVSFARLIDGDIPVPEPMLLASGHAALFWNEGALYADLEFLGDGRIAYFIKTNGDKHKGVLSFDSQKMPAVFQALIRV